MEPSQTNCFLLDSRYLSAAFVLAALHLLVRHVVNRVGQYNSGEQPEDGEKHKRSAHGGEAAMENECGASPHSCGL